MIPNNAGRPKCRPVYNNGRTMDTTTHNTAARTQSPTSAGDGDESPARRPGEVAGADAAADEHPIVFFDGVCGFCNSVVDFAMKHDREGVLRFAPLQGETARRLLDPSDVEDLNTFVFRDEQGLHRRSTAMVRLLSRLGGLWSVASVLLWIIPRPVRDVGYRVVAQYRYALFGKKEACRMPSSEERGRILP